MRQALTDEAEQDVFDYVQEHSQVMIRLFPEGELGTCPENVDQNAKAIKVFIKEFTKRYLPFTDGSVCLAIFEFESGNVGWS